MNKPKILLFDIETAPNLGYVWGKYDQNVIDYKSEWYMLCFVAKWSDSKKLITSKLSDFKTFKKDKENDYGVVKALWNLLDECDILIGHNSKAFDEKKANARFVYHGLPPPSPYKTIDTLSVARKYFKFTSNKLDDLGKALGIGRKVPHEGFRLWLGCMNGDTKSWNKMIKYNKQDVLLLEKLYKKLQPWITNHPNIGLFTNQEYACPNCGSKHVIKRGYMYTKVNKFQRYVCKDCNAWSSSRKAIKDDIKPELKN